MTSMRSRRWRARSSRRIDWKVRAPRMNRSAAFTASRIRPRRPTWP